jgi:hypothetical protein
MRLWHVIIIFTSIWLVACDSNNSTYTYNQAEISLQDIKEKLDKEFLEDMVEIFHSEIRSINYAVKDGLTLGNLPASEYKITYRSRVTIMVLDNFQAFAKHELRSARNPGQHKTPKHLRTQRNIKKELNQMIEILADSQLNKKWESLMEETLRIKNEYIARIAMEDADESRDKMLVWADSDHSGLKVLEAGNEDAIISCVIEAVKPLVHGKDWLVKKDESKLSEAARKTAWGTLAIQIDWQHAEFTEVIPGKIRWDLRRQPNRRREAEKSRKYSAKVMTNLKITVRPQIPDQPKLPKQWEVSVAKPKPDWYSPKDLSQKAYRVNAERYDEMPAEGCMKFRELMSR